MTTTPPGSRSIGDHGLIGDTRTAALVDRGGAITWLCVPRFDGPPVFASLVGGEAAGSFGVHPCRARADGEQRYLHHTAAVETRWTTPTGRLGVTDRMIARVEGQLLPTSMLVRQVVAHDQPVEIRIRFDPRLGDDHAGPRRTTVAAGRTVCDWGAVALGLTSGPATSIGPGADCHLVVEPGPGLTLVLSIAVHEPVVLVDPDHAAAVGRADDLAWREWCDRLRVAEPHRELVTRSLQTLRLLTYSPSGAPVAAPTTSLPEVCGGIRNWDYRYAWPRDASLGAEAFLGAGSTDDARAFLAWLRHASRLARPRLPAVLSIDGCPTPAERTAAGWPGFAGSAPVRFGNDARGQHQLDGYGWVAGAAGAFERAGQTLDSESWRMVRGFAGEVARRWRDPDAGIWERRDEPRHHVHSKLMALRAIDSAIELADRHPARGRHRRRWRAERDAIVADVLASGVDRRRNALTGSYGHPGADAAVLVLPSSGLAPPSSPLVVNTVDVIREELGAGGPLLYRYAPGTDGMEGDEGAFLPCSFWLVEALAQTGRFREATELFSDLAALANPLGLYPEEMDPRTGRPLGNFPQALTHSSLVRAAQVLATARPGLAGMEAPGGESPV